MKYLIESTKTFKESICVPQKYLKNKYSKIEYYLIKKGLEKFFTINDFQLEYTRNGKPFLNHDIFISISHSKDLVIVAFSKKPIGTDIEYIRNLPKSINKFLNLDLDLDNKDVIKEFCIRESIIKLEDKSLKDINDLSKSNYKIKIFEKKDYIYTIVEK